MLIRTALVLQAVGVLSFSLLVTADEIESGEVVTEKNYVDGKLEGRAVGYGKTGNVVDQGNYVDGKLEGKLFLYWDNGRVMSETNYVDGNKEGREHKYSFNGNITDIDIYKNGVCVEMCEERD